MSGLTEKSPKNVSPNPSSSKTKQQKKKRNKKKKSTRSDSQASESSATDISSPNSPIASNESSPSMRAKSDSIISRGSSSEPSQARPMGSISSFMNTSAPTDAEPSDADKESGNEEKIAPCAKDTIDENETTFCYKQAKNYLEKDNYPVAYFFLQHALENKKGTEDAATIKNLCKETLLGHGETHLEDNEFEKAIFCFNQALNLVNEKDNISLIFEKIQQAQKLLNPGEHSNDDDDDDEIAEDDYITLRMPVPKVDITSIGNTLLKEKRFDIAVAWFSQDLPIYDLFHPDDFTQSILVKKGFALYMAGEQDQGLSFINDHYVSNPENTFKELTSIFESTGIARTSLTKNLIKDLLSIPKFLREKIEQAIKYYDGSDFSSAKNCFKNILPSIGSNKLFNHKSFKKLPPIYKQHREMIFLAAQTLISYISHEELQKCNPLIATIKNQIKISKCRQKRAQQSTIVLSATPPTPISSPSATSSVRKDFSLQDDDDDDDDDKTSMSRVSSGASTASNTSTRSSCMSESSDLGDPNQKQNESVETALAACKQAYQLKTSGEVTLEDLVDEVLTHLSTPQTPQEKLWFHTAIGPYLTGQKFWMPESAKFNTDQCQKTLNSASDLAKKMKQIFAATATAMGNYCLENKKFAEAKTYFDYALQKNPSLMEASLGKITAEQKLAALEAAKAKEDISTKQHHRSNSSTGNTQRSSWKSHKPQTRKITKEDLAAQAKFGLVTNAGAPKPKNPPAAAVTSPPLPSKTSRHLTLAAQ